MKTVPAIIEKASDGGYGIYAENGVPVFGSGLQQLRFTVDVDNKRVDNIDGISRPSLRLLDDNDWLTLEDWNEWLRGYVNNITGQYGYRGADGFFYKSEDDYRAKSSVVNPNSLDEFSLREHLNKMELEMKKIEIPIPVGYLRHEPTETAIQVYHRIGIVRRLWLRWFFGLRYIKIEY